MANPIYRQATEYLTNFLGFGGKTNIIYDDFLLETQSPRFDKALEARANLKFHYPPTSDSLRVPKVRIFPFFEDIVIKESRAARYAENNILFRAEPDRPYINTEATKLSLEFSITLPHIAAFFDKYVAKDSFEVSLELSNIKSDMRKRILATFKPEEKIKRGVSTGPNGNTKLGNIVLAQESLGIGLNARSNIPLGEDESENMFMERAYAIHWLETSDANTKMTEFLPLIKYFLTILRSSVLPSNGGKSSESYNRFGPPLAVFNYGELYVNFPCIVKRYNLEFRPDYGYNHDTLINNLIRGTLELEEYRQAIGNLHGPYNESPVGWDDLFRNNGSVQSPIR
jgi:hypothetical protein